MDQCHWSHKIVNNVVALDLIIICSHPVKDSDIYKSVSKIMNKEI